MSAAELEIAIRVDQEQTVVGHGQQRQPALAGNGIRAGIAGSEESQADGEIPTFFVELTA